MIGFLKISESLREYGDPQICNSNPYFTKRIPSLIEESYE